jgi:MoaA/NifB/PqqE/SkfB family radical SAM enzyme
MVLGVRQLSFTGGEPFIVKDFVRILDYALQRAPCLVLTNGVDGVTKRLRQLLPLRERAFPLSLRVSIDWADEARHDAGRGAGNFRKALAAVRTLGTAGFKVSVARQMEKGEDRAAVDAKFATLFRDNGICDQTNIVSFPDFGIPGSHADVPFVTENCMTTFQNEASRREFMCAYSKMVVKKGGRMRVYACTLVDDDTDYDQGGTLAESLPARVMLRHHRCFSCFKYGATCSETKGH